MGFTKTTLPNGCRPNSALYGEQETNSGVTLLHWLMQSCLTVLLDCHLLVKSETTIAIFNIVNCASSAENPVRHPIFFGNGNSGDCGDGQSAGVEHETSWNKPSPRQATYFESDPLQINSSLCSHCFQCMPFKKTNRQKKKTLYLLFDAWHCELSLG